jgi:hypothetical protein
MRGDMKGRRCLASGQYRGPESVWRPGKARAHEWLVHVASTKPAPVSRLITVGDILYDVYYAVQKLYRYTVKIKCRPGIDLKDVVMNCGVSDVNCLLDLS